MLGSVKEVKKNVKQADNWSYIGNMWKNRQSILNWGYYNIKLSESS